MLRVGTPSWAEIIRGYVAEGTADVGVAIPGNVVSYSNGLASIRPGVRKLVPDEDNPDFDYPEASPVIPSVPVIWPRGKNFQIVGTLDAGDPVLLICADYDISAWMRSGQLSDPEDARGHSWGHGAVCIPGLVPDIGWSASAPTDAAALASKVDAFARAIASLAIPQNAGEALVAIAAVVGAFRAAYGIPPSPPTAVPATGTVASDTLLTDS